MSVQEAIAQHRAFQDEMKSFLSTVRGSLTQRWNANKPWEVNSKANALLEAGSKVESILSQVKQHLDTEEWIRKAKDDVKEQADRFRAVAKTLKDSEALLEAEIEKANRLLGQADVETEKSDDIPMDWVLQLARKYSYTTHAPDEWHCIPSRINTDYALPPRFHYPGPLQQEIQRGILFKNTQDLVQLAMEGKEPEPEPEEEKPANVEESAMESEEPPSHDNKRKAAAANEDTEPPRARLRVLSSTNDDEGDVFKDL